MYVKIDNETLAIINACEHEFSVADESHSGANGIDLIGIFNKIKSAKNTADYILVIIHGGHEHFQLPSLRMQDMYRFFIDAGADVVVNHHQHCYSGMEIYKDKPIYYGLGNFFFDWPLMSKQNNYWNEGILLELDLGKDKIKHHPIPFTQCKHGPSIEVIPEDSDFKNRFNALNSIISNRKDLKDKVTKYYMESQRGILSVMQPYRGRLFKSAYFRGILPSLIPKRKILEILNMIECESHHDKLKFILKKNIQ